MYGHVASNQPCTPAAETMPQARAFVRICIGLKTPLSYTHAVCNWSSAPLAICGLLRNLGGSTKSDLRQNEVFGNPGDCKSKAQKG